MGGAGRPGTPSPAEAAVRKTVTVLFCDLVGSTAFGERVDPEAAREAMGRYFQMASNAVETNDGTVAKFIGDGVMAVFGIPEVAEDDAERAVAAGLTLQRDFEPIRTHIRDRYGVEVGLRVGINTGEIVIGADDADIVGDALNTAARLEAACTPGRVLVGEDTWRLTRSRVTYEVLGEVTVKGKLEPIATFQVVEGAGTEDELATPFVGRDAEIDALRQALAAATTERAAQLVTVIGAPGVGKTRLALELARAQGDTVSWFDLRCERAGTATFAPVAELLRSAAGIDSEATVDEAVAAIDAWVAADIGDRDRLVALLASFVRPTASRSTEEMFFAARRLVELIARNQPALLVVDDIQWSEPLFLDLLEHLAEWVTDAPVLIVALARPEIRETRPSLCETGRRVAAVLSVEGLDASATERMAAQLLGADALPAELADRLPASTEGNPLFVRELVRMMVDDGVVTKGSTGWEIAVDPEAIQVPPTIQSLLSTRVERMPPAERRFVELAAVVGSEFPKGAVEALIADASRSEIDATVERLRRKEIIEATGGYWGDEPVFRFHHVLIRDAAYRRLLKRARADLHLLAGEWTERTAAELVGEHEPAIAFHYEQTHGYRTELGLLDDETTAVGDRAAALLLTAADRALQRDDLSSAGGLARRALARASPESAMRADLLLLACEALLGSGDVAGGRAVLDQLDAMVDDPRLEAWAACFHGQLITLTAPEELSFAEASVGAAAERLEQIDDKAGVAKARQVRAGALARLGRVGDCEAELDLALTAARAADDRRRVTAVLGSAPVAALWGPSPVPRAGGRCLDVIRLLRITTGSPAVEATSVRCQAVLEALRGRFGRARSMLESSRSTAEELGLRHGLMETELYAGIVELLAGEPAAAEPHLREAYGGLGKLGIGADAGQAAAHLARALLLQGHLDEAEELAAASDALAGQNPQTLIAARSAEAEILSARGDHDQAVGLAEEAVALATGRDIIVDHAGACMVLARVRRAAGDDVGADQAQAEAQRLYDLKGATIHIDAPAVDPADATTPVTTAMSTPPVPPNAATATVERLASTWEAADWADLADVFATDIPDELGSALALSVELTAPTTPVEAQGGNFGSTGTELDNAATTVARELLDAVVHGERGRIEAALADDHVLDDRRPMANAGPVSGHGDSVAALIELGAMIRGADLRVVATRGERLCLTSIVWDYVNWGPQRGLHLVEIDDARRQVVTVNYRSADLADAVAELDRMYVATLDQQRAAVFAVFAELSRMANGGSLDRAAVSNDPGAAFVERIEGQGAFQGVSVITAVDALTAQGVVLRHSVVVGRKHVVRSSIEVALVEHDRIRHSESFETSRRDAALARFEELTTGGEPTPTPGTPAVANAATALLADLRDAFNAGNWERFACLCADSFDYHPHHRGPRYGPLAVRDDFVTNQRARADLGYRMEFEVLAVRGDRLTLTAHHWRTDNDFVESLLAVLGLDDDGRLHHIGTADTDDLDTAVAELDRMYREGEGAPHRDLLANLSRLGTAAGRRAPDAWDEIIADDFVAVDHRSGSAGPELDRAAWLRSAARDAERGGEGVAYGRRFHRLVGDGAVFSFAFDRTVDGAEPGWPTTSLALFRYDRLVRLELWDDGEIDAALARLDELTAPTPDGGDPERGEATGTVPAVARSLAGQAGTRLENAATRVSDRLSHLGRHARFDELEAGVHPDAVTADHAMLGGGVGGRTDFVDGMRSWRDIVVDQPDHGGPLAVRGDRLALMEYRFGTEGDWSIDRIGVVQVDENDLLTYINFYDPAQRAEALAELDALHRSGDREPPGTS